MWSRSYLIGVLLCMNNVSLGRRGWGTEEGIIALHVKEQGEFTEFCLHEG